MRLPTVLLLSIVFTTQIAFGQKGSKTTILILAPNEVITNFNAEEIQWEESEMRYEIKNNAKVSKHLLPEDTLKMAHVMAQLEMGNFKNLDIFHFPSFIAYEYFCFHNNEKTIIQYLDKKSSNSKLQKICKKYNSLYVLNFQSAELRKDADRKLAKIHLQFYDLLSDSMVYDTTLIGEDVSNINFPYHCLGRTISCSITNALMNCLEQINFYVYFKNRPLKRPEEMEPKTYQLK